MVSELIDLSLEKWLKLIHALIAIRMSSSLDLTVLERKSANNYNSSYTKREKGSGIKLLSCQAEMSKVPKLLPLS